MNWFKRHRLIVWMFLLTACLATPCLAQDPTVRPPETTPLRLSEVGSAPMSFRPASNVPEITVAAGKSVIADSLIPVAKVSVAATTIADTYVISPTQLLITGKGVGTTSLFVWDKNGKMQSYDVVVQPDVTQLRARMKEAFPNEEINVTTLKDTVILSGPPADEYVAKKAQEIATPVTKNLINLLQPPPPKERQRILLQVKIAEVDRTTSKDLGLNMFKFGTMPVTSTTQQFGTLGPKEDLNDKLTFSDALNIFAFRRDAKFGAFLRDLETRGLLQILAEPNLLAYNGKEATFLAGGEFPVPIVQGTGLNQMVTIQFREFGVRLAFTPTLMPNGAIHMKLKPEVSTLDLSAGVRVGGTQVPGLSTRRVETEIELNEGESFGIAGLIDNRVIENYSRMPGLADIPIIGALFKSRARSKTNTELLVIVTPKIVQPFRPEQPPTLPEMDTPYLREPNLDGKLGQLEPMRKGPTHSGPRLDGKSGYQEPAPPALSGNTTAAIVPASSVVLTPATSTGRTAEALKKEPARESRSTPNAIPQTAPALSDKGEIALPVRDNKK